MSPRLVQKLEQHDLRDAAGVLGRHFGMADEALDDLGGAGDPADSGARGDDLGKGVETEDAAGGVEGKVGGDERGEKFGVRLLGGW